jgi:hypothetical protein
VPKQNPTRVIGLSSSVRSSSASFAKPKSST